MPRVSVFTPTHNPRFLDQAWWSLRAQTFQDWEWIVGLNGGNGWAPPVEDERIRDYFLSDGGVGSLKKACCRRARGEILVELDHDDLLTVDCLAKIVRAFDENPGASLVYSDFAQINEDGTTNRDEWDASYGWFYDDVRIRFSTFFQEVHRCKGLAPTPHNVSYIWYAPNHVRAFSRAAYEKAGGYDARLEICDDQDLMCRLYQVGPFVHIPECLYLQRVHPNMTQKIRNAEIQSTTVDLYDRYVQDNALAWAKREGLACLDLGGATGCPPGYEPVDRKLGSEASTRLGELAGKVGVVRAVDFLEHNDALYMMQSIHDALAPGGMLLSLTPSTDGRGAFCDPTHISFWNELSFRYYTEDTFRAYLPVEVTPDFAQSRLTTVYLSDWHRDMNVPYVLSNLVKH